METTSLSERHHHASVEFNPDAGPFLRLRCRRCGSEEPSIDDENAEAEPDEVPPCEAAFHVVPALLGEVEELEGVGGAVEEAVFEARRGVGEGGLAAAAPVGGGNPWLVVQCLRVAVNM